MPKRDSRKKPETMTVEWRPVAEVIPYARNPRLIPDSAIGKVAASIKEFGFKQPIVVDQEGVIVVGHTRLAAAQRLGMEHVPVLVASDLSPAQVKAYRIADNRTGQEAEWDLSLLSLEFEDLAAFDFDVSLTGFEPSELVFGDEASEIVEDEAPEPPEEPITKPGDLWLLGEHRVLCGDATVATDVERLMGGGMACLMWTDPPYGVSYVGKTKDALTIRNDGSDDVGALLYDAFTLADTILEPGSPFYVAHPAGALRLVFENTIPAVGWRHHESLIWVKDSMVLGHADYHFRHEPIIYGWTQGEGRSGRGNHEGSRWYGGHDQTSVFEIPRPKRSEDHPTMKPVELVARCVQNSSPKGGAIYDPFLGSGTTLIAAEQLGRICYGLEIDPRYCDVIVNRWEAFTGKKAERVS